jgi:hypothetical protein
VPLTGTAEGPVDRFLDYAMDAIQVLFWVIIISFGIPGARSARRAVKDMDRKIRHSEADMAYKLLDNFHSDNNAKKALGMLEPRGPRFARDEHGKDIEVKQQEVEDALRKSFEGQELTHTELLILDCFDYYFFYLDRIRHAVQTGLIRLEDISPVNYYVRRMAQHKEWFQARMMYADFGKLPDFLESFPTWSGNADAASEQAVRRATQSAQ